MSLHADDGVADMEIEGQPSLKREPRVQQAQEEVQEEHEEGAEEDETNGYPHTTDEVEGEEEEEGEEAEEYAEDTPPSPSSDPSAPIQTEADRLAEERVQAQRDKDRRKSAKLKRQMRKLEEFTHSSDIASKMEDPNSTELPNTLELLNRIHDKLGAKDVSGGIVSAQVLNTIGRYGVQQARRLTAVMRIDVEEVLDKFQQLYAPRDDDDEGTGVDVLEEQRKGSMWHRFGQQVAHRFRSVECTSFMKGLLNIHHAPKEKKARRARAVVDDDDADEPVVHAEHLVDTSKEAESMTDRRVTQLWHHLPDLPTSLFTVLLHPTDFTQSIENLFDLTFLIKKGQAAINIDEELGIPMVRRVKEEEEDVEGEEALEQTNYQSILAMNMGLWKELVEAFKIRKPFLRDRRKQYQEAERAQQGQRVREGQRNGAASSAAAASSSSSASKRRRNDLTTEEKIPDFFSPSQPTMNMMMRERTPSAKKARRAEELAEEEEEGDEETGDEGDADYQY